MAARKVQVTAISSETGDLGAQEYRVTLVAVPDHIRQIRPVPHRVELPPDVLAALAGWLDGDHDD